MKIAWVHYNTVKMGKGRLTSQYASARYRMIVPVESLIARGHDLELRAIDPYTDAERLAAGTDSEVFIFAKPVAPNREVFAKISATTTAVVRHLQARGRVAVTDICDHYFAHALYGNFFREFVRQVDAITVNTPEMATLVATYTDRPIHLVTDPFEAPPGEPRLALAPPPPRWKQLLGAGRPREVRLLWFGHESNWKTMRPWLEPLRRQTDCRITLQVISAQGYGVEDECAAHNARAGGHCRIEFTPWSEAATWEGLARADAVLLPSWADDAGKSVKSPNRLVETIRTGRFGIVSPLPAYQRLAPYCWIGEDLVEGLRWTLAHPDEALQRIAAGQRHIEEHYSPARVGAAWETALAACAGLVKSKGPERD